MLRGSVRLRAAVNRGCADHQVSCICRPSEWPLAAGCRCTASAAGVHPCRALREAAASEDATMCCTVKAADLTAGSGLLPDPQAQAARDITHRPPASKGSRGFWQDAWVVALGKTKTRALKACSMQQL